MRKITYAAWSVEMNKWLVKMRSHFRVVKPGISILLRGHRLFSGRRSFCAISCSLWSRQKAAGSPIAARLKPAAARGPMVGRHLIPGPYLVGDFVALEIFG
jgi:hypothetical protein